MRARRRLAFLAGLCAALGLALGAAYSRRRVREAEERFPPVGRLIELEDGVVMHVVEAGAGSPVVLIHGADGVLQGFTETVFDELARDHRVIAVDRPGHGYSTLPAERTPCVALNVRLIREALARMGVERPLVVGASYGAATALRWTIDHPGEIRGLALVAPVAHFPWQAPLWLLRLPNAPLVGPALCDALVVPVGGLLLPPLARRAFHPLAVPERYSEYSHALFLRPKQFAALAEEYRTLRDDVAGVSGRYGEIRVPTVIVVGDGDRVTRPEHHALPLSDELPGAELVVLPGVGHELKWARPDALVDAVRRVEERAAVP